MSDPGTEPGKQHKANAVLEQMGGVSGLIYSSLPEPDPPSDLPADIRTEIQSGRWNGKASS